MKKSMCFIGILAIVLVFGMMVIGCDNGTTNNDPVFDGSVTFSDGLPAGTWAIYVTPDTVSSFANGSTAMTHYVAAGASTSVSGNKVNLITTGATGGTFNKNNSYTVIFYNTSDVYNMKYKSSVQFSGGNATITYSSMTNVSAL
jgi:hypothetical protein